MHACLNVDEIVRLIACELVDTKAKATAVALARCNKSFEDPVLDALWETQKELHPLLKSLPGDIWDESESTFKRPPTILEWARFRKYARRMRMLGGYQVLDVLSLEVVSILQLHASTEPLFPNIETLDLWPAGEFIPFIPLFLSPRTTTISIGFSRSDFPKATVASMITSFPILCPNLQDITLHHLPRDLTITAAVSGMLLASNRNTLRSFCINSLLTKEAREVISTLPNLHTLSVVIERNTSLPSVVLPNLTDLTITYHNGNDWLYVFHEATLGPLEAVTFHSYSEQNGDFLEAFERVTLATSIQHTLSKFRFYARCPWNPNYSSLRSFTQMRCLIIEFPCNDVCSSTVDDDVVMNLAQTMQRLETLELGDRPCREIPTGVTVKGLVALAHHCPVLSILRVHFQVASLIAPPLVSGVTPSAGSTAPWRDCALRYIEVGEVPVPEDSALVVAVALARIFPHIASIGSDDRSWFKVENAICLAREIINHSRAALEGGS